VDPGEDLDDSWSGFRGSLAQDAAQGRSVATQQEVCCMRACINSGKRTNSGNCTNSGELHCEHLQWEHTVRVSLVPHCAAVSGVFRVCSLVLLAICLMQTQCAEA
jgi:hypothetical protein